MKSSKRRSWVRAVLPAILMVMIGSANAAVITYASRGAFDAANPGLSVEGFENCSSTTQAFTGPLNSTTNNAACQTGDILPGISFGDSPGPDTNGLFIAGPLQNGLGVNPTTALGQNTPSTDALVITLAGGVNAIAFDLFQNVGGGQQSGSTLNYPIDLFDLSNNLLGSFSVAVASGSIGFFGAYSDTLIARVSINNRSAFDEIDNVAFNSTPEPGTLALLGLGVAGLAASRRRKQ